MDPFGTLWVFNQRHWSIHVASVLRALLGELSGLLCPNRERCIGNIPLSNRLKMNNKRPTAKE